MSSRREIIKASAHRVVDGMGIDLANRQQRVLVGIGIDTSISMDGLSIQMINSKLPEFIREMRRDSLVRSSFDGFVMSFGGVVTLAQDWTNLVDFVPPIFTAGGGTPMGECFLRSAPKLVARHAQYRSAGIPTFRKPLKFILSDGGANDDQHIWNRAVETARSSDVAIFVLSTCEDVSALKKMKELTDRIWYLHDDSWKSAFDFIINTVTVVSNTRPGEELKLEAPKQATYVDALQL